MQSACSDSSGMECDRAARCVEYSMKIRRPGDHGHVGKTDCAKRAAKVHRTRMRKTQRTQGDTRIDHAVARMNRAPLDQRWQRAIEQPLTIVANSDLPRQ